MVAATCSSTLPLCQRFWIRMPPLEERNCNSGPPPLIEARRLCWSLDADTTGKSVETPPPLVLASTSRCTLLATSTVMLPPEVDRRQDSLGCAERNALTFPPDVEASTAPVVSRTA